MALPVNLDPLRLFVEGRYIDVASGCLVIFDYFLTLDLEIKFIWKSKWNMMKVIYFLNRYATVLDFVLICLRSSTTDTTHCPGIMKAEIVVYILGVYFAEYTFAMRTYIMWQKTWKIWLPLCVYYIATFIYIFIAYYSIFNHAQFMPLAPFYGCIPVSAGSFRWQLMSFIVAYDSAMLILVGLAAVIGAWKDGALVKSKFFRVLYGEGILFYFCLLLLSISSLLTIEFLENPIFLFMGRCVRSILASRVILHIRETAYYDKDHPIPLLPGNNSSTSSSLK